MNSYLFDSGWDRERRRLEALCALYDEGSQRLLANLRPRAGWRCLEVAAGTGTIARWLAGEVGRHGHVVATDIDPRFLENERIEGVEIRRSDILVDPLEESSFDLIHARALLMHLPERERAIDNMLRALRPGGTLLLEDIILTGGVTWPELPVWRKVIDGASAAFQAVGADAQYGIKLRDALRRRGFETPGFEVRAPVATTGTPSQAFYALCLEQLRPVLLRARLLTEAEIDEAQAALEAPGRVTLAPLMAAGWIARPNR